MVGFGQAKAANPLAGCQLGQVLLALGFGAEFVNGHHHQRTLHAHHGAVAAVHALHFAGDQAVNPRSSGQGHRIAREWWGPTGPVHHLAEDGGIGRGIAKGLVTRGCNLSWQ